MKNKKRSWSKFRNYIYSFILVLVLALVLVTVMASRGIPSTLRMFSVESGSMEPAIDKGSLVLVKPQDTYEEGSVITFTNKIRPSDTKQYTITHRLDRIIEQSGKIFYQTKGDANNSADQVFVPQENVVGQVVYTLPYIGTLIDFMQSRLGFVLIILLPSLLLIINESFVIRDEIGKIKERRAQKKNADLLGSKPDLALPLLIIVLVLIPFTANGTLAVFTSSERINNNKVASGDWYKEEDKKAEKQDKKEEKEEDKENKQEQKEEEKELKDENKDAKEEDKDEDENENKLLSEEENIEDETDQKVEKQKNNIFEEELNDTDEESKEMVVETPAEKDQLTKVIVEEQKPQEDEIKDQNSEEKSNYEGKQEKTPEVMNNDIVDQQLVVPQ